MTQTCERCLERLGELLQWELEHPATAALASTPAPSAQADTTSTALATSALAPVMARASEPDQAPLTEEETRELWQHASQCPECREALALLRSARQVLAALPEMAPPADLRARIRAGIASAPAVEARDAAAVPVVTATKASTAKATSTKKPRPWWEFWSAAPATQAGAPPLAIRKPTLPRAVWAGGGALVAAFGLVLALQVQRPGSYPVTSEADYAAAPPSAGAAPGAVSDSPKAPQASSKEKDAAATPKDASPAPGTQPPSVASPSAPSPGATAQSPQVAPPASAPPESRPLFPRRERPRRERPRRERPRTEERPRIEFERPVKPRTETRPRPQVQRPQIPSRPTEPTTQAAAPAASSTPRPTSREPEAKLRIAIAPARDASAASTYTAPTLRGGSPESADAVAGGRTFGALQRGDSARSDALESRKSPGVQDGSPAPPLGAQSAGPNRSPNRLRSAPPQAPAAPAPSLAPAPGGGQGGFSAPGGTGGLGATPRPRAIVPPPEDLAAPPGASPAPAPNDALAQAVPANPLGELFQGGAPQSFLAEVTATRDIKLAEVEVVLDEGWAFARGEGSRRVVWLGEASAKQTLRIPVSIRSALPGASGRAGSVILRDASAPKSRELLRADIVIPEPTPNAPAEAPAQR